MAIDQTVRCCREVSGMTLFDVGYKDAVGEMAFGSLVIEKLDPTFGMWLAVAQLQSSDEPDNGSGIVRFDCGATSNFQSGQFRYRVVLSDSVGATNEFTGDFPADICT